MLMFVSDLHLADDRRRGSMNARAFKAAIEGRLNRPVGRDDEQTTLVLLGDIAELLKSDIWLAQSVRPWGSRGAQLNGVVMEILEGIARENREFFDCLHDLHSKRNLAIRYVPGNHDGLFADGEIEGLRARWRELIPGLPGQGDESFERNVVCFDHGVWAEHGHELDDFNLPIGQQSRYVPGDAVVIELVLQLPRLVASALGARRESLASAQFEPQLMFLHELDNVLPQSLSGMMLWLESQLSDLPRADGKRIEDAVSQALGECATRLAQTMSDHGARQFERRVLDTLTAHTRFIHPRWLRRLAKFPVPSADQGPRIAARLSAMTALSSEQARSIDLYVSGHTHESLQREFALANRAMKYLNTGTWRRTHMPARSFRGVKFHQYYEETLLCVHRLCDRAQHGRYEFLRYVRGP